MPGYTLEESNAALRSVVEARLAHGIIDEGEDMVLPEDIAVTESLPCCKRAEVLSQASTAERTLQRAMDAVRDRHGKYGPPTEHFGRTASMVNAAFGTTFTSADWALVMVLDKVARQLGTEATDDAAIDIAGYAACHEECRRRA